MATLRSDPLLGIARGVITFFMGIALLVAAALVIAAPFLLIFRQAIIVAIASEMGHTPTASMATALAAVMLLAAAMMATGFLFLRAMRRIVDSVGQGDPFVPANADRLRQMGWLLIAIELVAIPASALGAWIEANTKNVHLEFSISITGFLLALVLFILARVFRTGALMREELEGMV